MTATRIARRVAGGPRCFGCSLSTSRGTSATQERVPFDQITMAFETVVSGIARSRAVSVRGRVQVSSNDTLHLSKRYHCGSGRNMRDPRRILTLTPPPENRCDRINGQFRGSANRIPRFLSGVVSPFSLRPAPITGCRRARLGVVRGCCREPPAESSLPGCTA